MFINMMTALLSVGPLPTPRIEAQRLYACGDDQVREYRIENGRPVEVWRWSAAQAADLPARYRTTLLAHIDDCKPVDDTRGILVTASTGGVVLIDRATGRVTFRATAPMAHSADLLPGGLIAVALSINPEGDRLEVYDRTRSETPLVRLPLPSGHGAVWDATRARLFVLSHDLIQAFGIAGTRSEPVLAESARWTLPGRRDGHDLSRRPDGRYLVTTDDGVWTFDPEAGEPATGTYTPLPALNPKLRVKAVGMMGDRLAWVQAEESWWAKGFTIARVNGSDPVRMPVEGLHLYKVRWIR
jgi:hypothetical protein